VGRRSSKEEDRGRVSGVEGVEGGNIDPLGHFCHLEVGRATLDFVR
jgi:hypothetical protein